MTREIPLTQGRVALVDDEDYERVLAAGPWHALRADRTYYARHSPRPGASIHMHRLVLGAQPGQDVDHANRDGLDNRRTNLRLATPTQNNGNRAKWRTDTSSIYKGVSRHGGRWQAYIQLDGHQRHLGRFDTEEAAARAYDAAAREAFGEFARPNLGDA